MPCVLELRNACRRINSEFYLKDINLRLEAGRATALIGRNASGKTSLLRMVYGVSPMDRGEALFDGEPVKLDAATARKLGILTLEQNGKGFPGMNIYQNIYFGREIFYPHTPIMNDKAMCTACQQVLDRMGAGLSAKTRLKDLTEAQTQLARLAAAFLSEVRVLVLDEPTTRLSPLERSAFCRGVQELKRRGTAVLLVSHDMDEILGLADEIAVMERGRLVETVPVEQADSDWLVQRITGRQDLRAEELYSREGRAPGEERGQLCRGGKPALSLRAGEVCAITGAADCGLEEAALAAAGFAQEGWSMRWREAALENPVDGIRAGVSLSYTAAWEEKLRRYQKLAQSGQSSAALSRKAGTQEVLEMTGQCFAQMVGAGKKQTEYYTGGNLQRELVTRAMETPAELYVLYSPTVGVDWESRSQLYWQMNQLACQGAAVLLCTYNPAEAAGMADRVLVLHQGEPLECLEREPGEDVRAFTARCQQSVPKKDA